MIEKESSLLSPLTFSEWRLAGVVKDIFENWRKKGIKNSCAWKMRDFIWTLTDNELIRVQSKGPSHVIVWNILTIDSSLIHLIFPTYFSWLQKFHQDSSSVFIWWTCFFLLSFDAFILLSFLFFLYRKCFRSKMICKTVTLRWFDEWNKVFLFSGIKIGAGPCISIWFCLFNAADFLMCITDSHWFCSFLFSFTTTNRKDSFSISKQMEK